MTHRERHANDGATVPTLPPPSAQGEVCAIDTPPPTVMGSTQLQTQLQRANPIKQIRLLNEAARCGTLCEPWSPFPLGVERNGSIEFERWNFISRLASGKKHNLSRLNPAPVETIDEQLDAKQRHAVSVALSTPDLAMIAGLPGTGKSRVVTEIVAQAARRGERVLLLAPDGAAVDHVLHRLADCDDVWAYRCVNGSHDGLSQTIQSMTGVSQSEQFRRLAKNAGNVLQAAAEDHRRKHGEHKQRWPVIRATAEKLSELRRELDAASARTASLHDEVVTELADAESIKAENHSLLSLLRDAEAKRDGEFADIEKRREESVASLRNVEADAQALRGDLEKLQPLADAKRNGRWWTWNWWAATFRGKVLQTRDELLGRQEALETQRTTLVKSEQDSIAERKALELRIRNEVVDTETARRADKLNREIETLREQESELRRQWREHLADIDESLHPKSEHCDAVDAAIDGWRRASDPDQNCRCAKQWATHVGESAERVGDRVAEWANVVAGPIAEFIKDPHFQTVAPKFDLLVLEESDRLAESDFVQLGRWAKRWILVGEAVWEGGASPNDDTSAKAKGATAPNSLLYAMWRHFHPDPRRLPFRWLRRDGKLHCQLRQVESHERKWIETENVADSPDIELRIVNPPKDDPYLVEVVFPDETNIADAKRFLFQETDELAIQSGSPTHHWRDHEQCCAVQFGSFENGESICIELEPGVCEWVDPQSFHTNRLEFHKDSGWRRDKSEEWLQDRIPLDDLQRTAFLSTPHRMTTTLSHVLSDVLFRGGYASNQNGAVHSQDVAGPHVVEFIPIPPLQRRQTEDAPPQLPSEGAGLELNLKKDRPSGRLPKDIAGSLPKHGFINVQEAHAVVRKLEQLATEVGPLKNAISNVFVLALFAAQTELIRRFASRSSVLKKAPFAVEYGLPQDYRHRESSVVLISLTRSHARRAVSFGDNESHMVLAMTRARNRLILFGDPGTLVRRSQWTGGNLDRLDAVSVAREKQVVSDLVQYLKGKGRFADAFRVVHEDR